MVVKILMLGPLISIPFLFLFGSKISGVSVQPSRQPKKTADQLEKETLKNGKDRLNIPKINTNSIQFLENEMDAMSAKEIRSIAIEIIYEHHFFSFDK